MRTKAIAVALVFLASLASYPASAAKGKKEADFRVWTERDGFKPGVVVVRSTPIRVKDVQFLNPWFALLEAGYIYSEDGSFGTYIFDMMYHGSEWMFWEELTAKIDTEVQSLKLVGQPRRDPVYMGVEERVRFEVPRDFFEKMAAAPSVDFRVNGKYYYDFFLNSTGTSYLAQLRDFVREKTPQLAATKENLGVPAGKDVAGGTVPSYVQELRELAKLRAEGIISEEEFQAKKRLLLGVDDTKPPSPAGAIPKEKKEEENSEAPPNPPPPNSAAPDGNHALRACLWPTNLLNGFAS